MPIVQQNMLAQFGKVCYSCSNWFVFISDENENDLTEQKHFPFRTILQSFIDTKS